MAFRVWRRKGTIVKKITEAEIQDIGWCSTRRRLAKTKGGRKRGRDGGPEVQVLDMTEGATTDIDRAMMMTDGITVIGAETKMAIAGIVTDRKRLCRGGTLRAMYNLDRLTLQQRDNYHALML